MKEEAHYFRVGLFIVGAFALLVAAIIIFGVGTLFQRHVYFETYMAMSVQGVEVGSPVKFRGVTIGKIKSIDFLFNEYAEGGKPEFENYVVLKMEITGQLFPGIFEKDISPILAKAIERGLRARVEPLGVTGLSYIEIDYLNPHLFQPLAINWKPRYYYIPSAPGRVTNMLDSVNNIMRDLERMDLEGISGQMSTALTGINDALRDARLPQLSERTDAAMVGVREAADAAKTVMQNLEPASQINSDDVDITLSNLRALTNNFRDLSQELRKNPSKLLFGKPPKKSSVMEKER